ncbi:MAG TPA: T9SS type A sorting domain-containing protein [bacterium]|nr:T9SS type A sorting domain-containing protein [bacterium]
MKRLACITIAIAMLFVGLATTKSKAAVCGNGDICVQLTDEFSNPITGDGGVLVDIITEGGNGNYFSPPNSVWPNVCDGTTGLCGDDDNAADGTVTLMSTSLSGSIFEAGTNDYSIEIESTSGFVKYPLTMFDYTTGAANTITTGLKYTIKVVVKDQFGNAIAADGVTPHSVTIANSTSCNGTYEDGELTDMDGANDGVIFIKCPIDGSDTLDLTVSAAGFVDYTFTGANVSNNAQNVFNSLNQYSLRIASGSIEDELGNTITPANSADVISWFTGSTTPSTTTVKKALVSSNHVYIAATGNANLTLGYPGYLESILLAVTPNTTAQQDIAYTAGNALEFQIVVDSTVLDDYEDILGTDLTVDDDETFYVCPSANATFSDCVTNAVAATIEFNADNKAYIAPAVAVGSYKVAVSKPGYAGVIDSTAVTTNWTTAENPDFNVAGTDAFGYHLVVKVYNELSVAIAGATVSHNGTPCTVVGGVDSNFYYCTTNTSGPIAVSKAGYMDLKVTIDTALTSVGVSTGNMTEITLDAATACTGGDPAGTSVTCSGLKYPIKIVVEDELGNPVNGIATNQITLGGNPADFVNGNELLYNTDGVLAGTVPGYRQNSSVASGALTVTAGTAMAGQTVLNLTGGATQCAGGVMAAGDTLECAGLGFPLVVDAVQNELGVALTLEATDFVAVYPSAGDCTAETNEVASTVTFDSGKQYIKVANGTYRVKYGKIAAGYVNTCDTANVVVNSAGAVVKPGYVGATDGLDYTVKVQLLNENDTALDTALDTGRLTLTVGGVAAAAVSGNYAYYPVVTASGNAVVGGYKGYINVNTGSDGQLADVQVDESAGQTLVNLTEQLVACAGANVVAGATANCRGLLYQIKATSGGGEVITDATNELTYVVGDTFTVCQGTSAPADSTACVTETPVKSELSGTTRYIAPDRADGDTYVMLYRSGYVKTISAAAATAAAGPQRSLAFNGANAVKHSIKVVIETELGEVPATVYPAGSYTVTIATQTSTQRVANASYFAVPTAGAMTLGFNNGTVGFQNVLTTLGNDQQLQSVQAGVDAQTVVTLTGSTLCTTGTNVPAGSSVTCRGLRYPVHIDSANVVNDIAAAVTLDGTETIAVCTDATYCTGGPEAVAAQVFDTDTYYIIPGAIGSRRWFLSKDGYVYRQVNTAAINYTLAGTTTLTPLYTGTSALKHKLRVRMSDQAGAANYLTDIAKTTLKLMPGDIAPVAYDSNYYYFTFPDASDGTYTLQGGYRGFVDPTDAGLLATFDVNNTGRTEINMTAALGAPCGAITTGIANTCERLRFQIMINRTGGAFLTESGAAPTNLLVSDQFKVCSNAPPADLSAYTCTDITLVSRYSTTALWYLAPDIDVATPVYVWFYRAGYVETVDLDAITVGPAIAQQSPTFSTAWDYVAGTRGDRIQYPIRVDVADEFGTALTTPWTLQFNGGASTVNNGASSLLWTATAAAPLTLGKEGYLSIDAAADTQLASVEPGVSKQTIVTLSGTTPCAGGSVAAGSSVTCNGLKHNVIVNVGDELGNDLDTLGITLAVSDITLGGSNAKAVDGNTLYYAAPTAGVLALASNNANLGFKNISTAVDTQLASIQRGTATRTTINLSGTTVCNTGGFVAVGSTVACNGLDYQIKMLSGAGNLEDEIGGTFTLAQADIDNSRIEVCNVADCATSDAAVMRLSGGSIYIAPTAAAGDKYIKYALPGYMETIAPAITATTAAGAPVSPVFSGASGLPFALKLAGADVENELGGAVALVGGGLLQIYPAGQCVAGTGEITPDALEFNGGNWYAAIPDGSYQVKYGQSGYITTCDADTTTVDTTLTGAQAAPDFTLAGTDGLEFSVKLAQGDLLNELGAAVTLAGGDTFKLFSNPDCTGEAVYISGPTFDTDTWYAAVADGNYTPQYTQSGYLRTCDSAPVAVAVAGGSAGIIFTESLPFTVKFDETVVEDELGNALASLDGAGTLKLFGSLVDCQAGAPESAYVTAPSNPDGNWYVAVANGTYFAKLTEPGYIATCDTTGIVIDNTSATPFAPQWAMADGDGLMLPVKVVVEDVLGNTITGIPAGAITIGGTGAVAGSGLTNELYYAVSAPGLLEGGVSGYMEVHTVSGGAVTVTPGTDVAGQTVISLTNGATTCGGGLIAAGDTATCAGISFPMVVDTGAAAVQNELGNSLAPLVGTDTLTVHSVADCATGANPVGTATFDTGKWYVSGLTDGATYAARYGRAGYVPTCDGIGKTIDASGAAVNPDFTLAGTDGVKFQLKVVVNDELGNPINDTTVRHGATVAPFSSGNSYYFNTTVAGDVSSTRAGYITSNTGRDTSLSNVPVATTQQRVITFDGATYCTVDNTTSYAIPCAGQKFYLKVVANDRWGNPLTGLTVAHNGVAPAYADAGASSNEYYFNVNATNGALTVGGLTGYTDLNTGGGEDTAAASINYSNVTQTVVTLNGETRCTDATPVVGLNLACRGLYPEADYVVATEDVVTGEIIATEGKVINIDVYDVLGDPFMVSTDQSVTVNISLTGGSSAPASTMSILTGVGETNCDSVVVNSATDVDCTISTLGASKAASAFVTVSAPIVGDGTDVAVVVAGNPAFANNGAADAGIAALDVVPGPLATLEIAGEPASTIAGDVFIGGITVTAKDAEGNIKTDYEGTVTFTSNDASATLPADYTFTLLDAGVKTFAGADFTLVTAPTLTATITVEDTVAAGPINDTTANIEVVPGALSYFTITGVPAAAVAGTAFATPANDLVVTAYDAQDNVKTNYTGTIAFTSTDGSATLPANYPFLVGDAGTKTFAGSAFTLNTTGNQTITITDAVAVISETTANIAVAPGALSYFEITGVPAAAVAGTAFATPANDLIVTAYDAQDNVKTDYTGTIAFTSTDGAATLPANYPFLVGDAGTKTFAGSAFTLNTTGNQTITITDAVAVISEITGNIAVAPGALSYFEITGVPAAAAAGTAFATPANNIVVTAYDAQDNVKTDYTGTIAFTSTDGAATLPGNYPFLVGDAGTKTFAGSAFTLNTTGNQTITITDAVAVISETTANIAVTPGALSYFEITGVPAAAVAGTAFATPANDLVVTAYDAQDNVKTDYTGTIAFTSTDVAATLPANYPFLVGDAGTKTFAGSAFTLNTTGNQTITVTDGVAVISETTGNIAVAAGALSYFTITGAPATTYAGIAFTNPITVTAYDAQDNIKTNYTGEIEFTSPEDALATLPANYTFVGGDNGAKIFAGAEFILRTTPSATIVVTDTATSINEDTGGIIVVNPGTLGAIEITGAPATIKAGEAFSGDITVTAKDLVGNVKTDYVGTVTFTSSDEDAELPADYTFVLGDAGVRVFAAADFKLFAASLTATITVTDEFEDESGSTGNIVVTADADLLNPTNLASVAAADFPGTTTYANDLAQIVLEYPTTDQIDILQMLIADGATTYPVTVHIFDNWGNPVPGVQVYLIRIDGGAGRVVARVAGEVSGFDVPAVTDENGAAIFNLVSDEGGEFEFEVRYQTDDGDIIGPNSFRISFQIADTHAPTLTITEKGNISVSLADNDIFEIGQDITLNFSVYDDPSDTSGIDLAAIKLYVDGTAIVNGAQESARIANRSGNQVVPGASSCEFNPATMEGVCVWDTDGVPAAGTYNLTLEVADNHGNPVTRTFAIRMVAQGSFQFGEVYAMPNPMTLPGAGSSFTFQSTRPGVVTIEVYTSTGRLVWMTTAASSAGFNQIPWDGRSINGDYVAAGVYFYRIIGSFGGSSVEGKGKIAVIK